jgi:hypothetical protein
MARIESPENGYPRYSKALIRPPGPLLRPLGSEIKIMPGMNTGLSWNHPVWTCMPGWFRAGETDEFALQWGLRRFHKKLKSQDIDAHVEYFKGGHFEMDARWQQSLKVIL